jgi:hypothetical protein
MQRQQEAKRFRSHFEQPGFITFNASRGDAPSLQTCSESH